MVSLRRLCFRDLLSMCSFRILPLRFNRGPAFDSLAALSLHSSVIWIGVFCARIDHVTALCAIFYSRQHRASGSKVCQLYCPVAPLVVAPFVLWRARVTVSENCAPLLGHFYSFAKLPNTHTHTQQRQQLLCLQHFLQSRAPLPIKSELRTMATMRVMLLMMMAAAVMVR